MYFILNIMDMKKRNIIKFYVSYTLKKTMYNVYIAFKFKILHR